ncbi:hypothetical protein [Flindersiella endophytica]
MGAYFGMELNAMATMLYGQRAEPWHASADIWGSACQHLLSTHGDLGAANAVIKTWPLSVGSVSQAAFSGQVIGSLATLAEWSAYTGAMSAALRLGGTAIYAAQAVMPMLQSGYDTAMALSTVPIIGPFAAQAAMAIQATGAGMMEAVGGVMQAPTAVPSPAQGWQGPGGGGSMPASPVPAVPAGDVLGAADKLAGLFEKSASLAQTVMGLAQSANTGNLDDLGDLDLPSLAGDTSTGAPVLGSALTGNAASAGGVPGTLVAGGSALGTLAGAAVSRGVAGQVAAGVPGARIGVGTEPALAGSTARAAATGVARATPAIAPPLSSAGGGGGGTEIRPGGRSGRDGAGDTQEERLRRSGVQPGLQGRAAREPVERFTLPPPRRRRDGAVLDEELFVAESSHDERRH